MNEPTNEELGVKSRSWCPVLIMVLVVVIQLGLLIWCLM